MRYIGAPRSVLNAAVSEMHGWRELGERILAQSVADCPVGDRTDERKTGSHLKDTLRLKLITGGDPRILIGSDTRGDVLDYVHTGTDAHTVPVPTGLLAFIPKGEAEMIFRHVDSVSIPAMPARPFIIEAMRKALGGG